MKRRGEPAASEAREVAAKSGGGRNTATKKGAKATHAKQAAAVVAGAERSRTIAAEIQTKAEAEAQAEAARTTATAAAVASERRAQAEKTQMTSGTRCETNLEAPCTCEMSETYKAGEVPETCETAEVGTEPQTETTSPGKHIFPAKLTNPNQRTTAKTGEELMKEVALEAWDQIARATIQNRAEASTTSTINDLRATLKTGVATNRSLTGTAGRTLKMRKDAEMEEQLLALLTEEEKRTQWARELLLEAMDELESLKNEQQTTLRKVTTMLETSMERSVLSQMLRRNTIEAGAKAEELSNETVQRMERSNSQIVNLLPLRPPGLSRRTRAEATEAADRIRNIPRGPRGSETKGRGHGTPTATPDQNQDSVADRAVNRG